MQLPRLAYKPNTCSSLMARAWPAVPSPAAWRVALRVAGGLGGGYAFTAALVSLLSAALTLAGQARSEAVVLAAMLGFVVYLLVLLWAFSMRSLLRLWTALAGGTGLLMAATAWLQ